MSDTPDKPVTSDTRADQAPASQAPASAASAMPTRPPLEVAFDPTPEIFATDTGGYFSYPLVAGERVYLDTHGYDEMRFTFSVWHPSQQRTIDLDRAYVELQASFDPQAEHFAKVAEMEPVVPAYAGGETFDGWIVLPVLAGRTALTLVGHGFEARARLQIRARAYLVA